MRVLIADDHAIVRQGLRALIEKEPDMEVIAETENGEQAVARAKELAPDIVIMDMTMPLLNGIEATKFILRDNPNIRIIALSMHSNSHIVKEALKAGALGYVLKSCLFDELSRALHAVAANTHYLSPQIENLVVEGYLNPSQDEAGSIELTARERQILQLLVEGKSVKEIGIHLHISPKTADATRRKMMNKLGITNLADLVRYAVREGLTSVEF